MIEIICDSCGVLKDVNYWSFENVSLCDDCFLDEEDETVVKELDEYDSDNV